MLSLTASHSRVDKQSHDRKVVAVLECIPRDVASNAARSSISMMGTGCSGMPGTVMEAIREMPSSPSCTRHRNNCWRRR